MERGTREAQTGRGGCASRTQPDAGRGRRVFTVRRFFGAALLVVATGLAAARAADVSASYDGTLRVGHATGLVAGALNQSGVGVMGTLAIDGGAASTAGVYWVTGKLRAGRLTVLGTSQAGVRIRWRAVLRGTDVLAGKARLRGAGTHANGVLALTRRRVDPPTNPAATCDSAYFTGQVMGRVLQPICAGCHVAGGAAANANFRVTPSDPLATQASLALNVDPAHPDESRILMKPLAQLPHGGGQQLSPGSPEEQILRQWVGLVATGHQCDGPADKPMVALAPAELLVRAAMDLRGLRPAPAELDAIEADQGTYASIVDGYLHSPEFLERVKDVYDDALLVRREDDDDADRDETSALYSEALELIAWIVGHDRPFTEIGTADYTVANQEFQSDPVRMPYPMEPVVGDEWQPTHYTDGRPHAGLLSTSAFYEVWTTNDTNKNRRRANRWSIVLHC